MKRRDVITLLGFLSLGGFAALWRNMGSFWRPGSNEHIAKTVAAVADLMFPGDGLPGASELGLHNRIVAMPELHGLMTKGVVWLDNRAALQGASDFLALDEASRLAAVDAAFGSHDDATQQFVLALRYHLGTAYYTEPVVKSAFAYTGPPQPDGFADFRIGPHERQRRLGRGDRRRRSRRRRGCLRTLSTRNDGAAARCGTALRSGDRLSADRELTGRPAIFRKSRAVPARSPLRRARSLSATSRCWHREAAAWGRW